MMTNSNKITEKKVRKVLSSEMSLGRIAFYFTELDTVRVDGVDLATIIAYIEYVENSIRGTKEGREALELELFQVIDPTLCFIEFEWARE